VVFVFSSLILVLLETMNPALHFEMSKVWLLSGVINLVAILAAWGMVVYARRHARRKADAQP